jgi:hypothetical protein
VFLSPGDHTAAQHTISLLEVCLTRGFFLWRAWVDNPSAVGSFFLLFSPTGTVEGKITSNSLLSQGTSSWTTSHRACYNGDSLFARFRGRLPGLVSRVSCRTDQYPAVRRSVSLMLMA